MSRSLTWINVVHSFESRFWNLDLTFHSQKVVGFPLVFRCISEVPRRRLGSGIFVFLIDFK